MPDLASADDDHSTEPQGQPSQAELWVDRYADALYRYAFAKTSNQGISEELVQETFLAAIKGQKRFRNESTASTWLFAILKRKIADHYRRSNRPGATDSVEAEMGVADRSETPGREWSDDPARIYEDQEFWKTFDQCVEKLPNKLAEVFILREVNQYSPKEICEILGLGATNLSMRLHRCRLALRECLGQNWFRTEQD